MFQEAALFPWLTAAQNVALPLRLAGRAEDAAPGAGSTELLDLVRLAGHGRQASARAVRRQRQRVALARALASTPGGVTALLLMDEPFAALDAITRDVLQAELTRVWQATGTASCSSPTTSVRPSGSGSASCCSRRVRAVSSASGPRWRHLDARREITVVREVISGCGTVITSHCRGLTWLWRPTAMPRRRRSGPRRARHPGRTRRAWWRG